MNLSLQVVHIGEASWSWMLQLGPENTWLGGGWGPVAECRWLLEKQAAQDRASSCLLARAGSFRGWGCTFQANGKGFRLRAQMPGGGAH